MGVKLKDLVEAKPITLDDLQNKIIIVDAMNVLYQFLATIRQPDGTPLKTSDGRITSHIVGLFSRTAQLMSHNIKLAFVFDGKPPLLKMQERERRQQLKVQAELRYEEAKLREDIDAMKKFAARTSKLNEDMINDAKELLKAMGIPIVQAPSEGEAQASFMIAKGDGYAIASEDYDSLLFGATRLIRGLTATKRRKGKEIEMITLSETLNKLGIDREKLIALAMIIGTDFNPGGIKGIGPVNALKIVKRCKTLDEIFKEVNWDFHFKFPWRDVFGIFTSKEYADYKLEWKPVDEVALKNLLVKKFEFSESNVDSKIKKLLKKTSQKNLQQFLR